MTATQAVQECAAPTLDIKLAFGGGVESLFNNIRNRTVRIPALTTSLPPPSPERPSDIRFLISWMANNILVERKELFLDGETVRPGILVLVNDTDWELEGELEYVLKEGDEVVFISTLHGG